MEAKGFLPFKLWHEHGYVNRFFCFMWARKGKKWKLWNYLLGANKPSGASRESIETTQNSIWEEKLIIGQRNVRKTWIKWNKIQCTVFKTVTSWKVFASILKHISSIFKYPCLQREWPFFLQVALLKNWK